MEALAALAALAQARTEFETRLRQIGADQWDAATPCSEWNVRQLVNHMMLGNRMAVQLLASASAQDVMAGFGDDLVGDGADIVASFAALADELHAGFAAPGGLEGTVNHPMGEMPRSMFVGLAATPLAGCVRFMSPFPPVTETQPDRPPACDPRGRGPR